MQFWTEIKRRGETRTLDLIPMNFTSRALTAKLLFAIWGVEAFNYFMGHLSQSGELKHEEGMGDSVKELKSLMRGHHIENNSEDNSKISGSLLGRIAKSLLYIKERKESADLEIGEIKKSLGDLAHQVKNGKNWKEKKYNEKKKEIIGKWMR